MTGSQPAKLLDGGYVMLTRRGAQLVLTSLEVTRRAYQAQAGDPDVSADFNWLYEVCSIAASFPPATVRASFTMTVPSSESRISVREAAEIHHVSEAAIRKAIGAGRLPAERIGSVWSIRETDARQLKVRRSHDRQASVRGRAGT